MELTLFQNKNSW